MNNARTNPPGNQMHRGFRGAGKISGPRTEEEVLKDPEENFTRSVTLSHVATLD